MGSKSGSESSVLGDSITLKKVEDNDLYFLEFGYEISYVENLLLREVDVGCKRDSKTNNKFLFTNQLKNIGRRGGNVRSSSREIGMSSKKCNLYDVRNVEKNSTSIENGDFGGIDNGNNINSISSAKKYWKSFKSYSSSFSSKKQSRNNKNNDGEKIELVVNPSILRSTEGVQNKDMNLFRSSHCASGRFVDKLQFFEKTKSKGVNSDVDKMRVVKQKIKRSRRFSLM